ncbi:MAG: hydantoinase B/oxoprolinase family protein, partial [Alphaproteobacteria bacterium]|nr:hydantoinase B/oxoprolinase family protein [Alphaproteobacteria bacterium]
HEFHFNAMFDRLDNAARGRAGGEAGAPGSVSLDDGTKLKGKGRQFVPSGRRLILQAPGGGGYGPPARRAPEDAARDKARDYLKI